MIINYGMKNPFSPVFEFVLGEEAELLLTLGYSLKKTTTKSNLHIVIVLYL